MLSGPLLPYNEVDEDVRVVKDVQTTTSSESRDKMWCMLLHIDDSWDCYGLLLASGKGGNGTCFQRLGGFFGDSGEEWLEQFRSCTPCVITII